MRRHVYRKGTTMSKRALPDVPVVEGINLDFRPLGYRADNDPVSAILQNITGQHRREMVRDFVTGNASKTLGELDERLMNSTLNDNERIALGQVCPRFMGGEYLPDYTAGELEIARIVLASSTRDVFSVRARTNRTGTRIYYSMHDEYDEAFCLSPKSSRKPLSLRALIKLIDTATSESIDMIGMSFVENFAEWQLQNGDTPDAAANFVSVESDVYLELGSYYAARLSDWAVEEQRANSGPGFIITSWRPPT